eukprot:scaffold76211_cov64-Phaeocystis_antarctica.AAC.5
MVLARATSSADSSAFGGSSLGRGSPRKCRLDGLSLAGLAGGGLPSAAASLAASRFACSDDLVRTMGVSGHTIRGAKERPSKIYAYACGGWGEGRGRFRRFLTH